MDDKIQNECLRFDAFKKDLDKLGQSLVRR